MQVGIDHAGRDGIETWEATAGAEDLDGLLKRGSQSLDLGFVVEGWGVALSFSTDRAAFAVDIARLGAGVA